MKGELTASGGVAPKVPLTATELQDLRRAVDAYTGASDEDVLAIITLGLTAVPRLALVSPMVGEMVNIADLLGKIALREHSGHSGDEETGEHYEDCERCEVEGLLGKLYALTGEEGRDEG